tara:strand:+ start:378 stop:497 length:120 start_codon:yes stop_codon:yes gene_type:complete
MELASFGFSDAPCLGKSMAYIGFGMSATSSWGLKVFEEG